MLLLFGWLIIPCFVIGIIVLAATSGKRGVAGCLPSLIACVAVVLILAWATDDKIYRDIHDSEVVGEWKLTTSSLALLRSDGYSGKGVDCTINLRADSTATFSSVNNWKSPPEHQTTEGFWKLERNTTKYQPNAPVRLEISELENRHHFISFGFRKHGGEMRLSDYHGDPDNWEFAEYSKTE